MTWYQPLQRPVTQQTVSHFNGLQEANMRHHPHHFLPLLEPPTLLLFPNARFSIRLDHHEVTLRIRLAFVRRQFDMSGSTFESVIPREPTLLALRVVDIY